MSQISDDDFELLIAYLDDRLIAEEATTLEVRLKAEAALAEAYIRLSRDQITISEWVTGILEPPLSTSVVPRERRWIRGGITASFVASAVCCVLFLVPTPTHREKPLPSQPPQAQLVQLEEIDGEAYLLNELGEPIQLVAGQMIHPGQQVVTSEGGRAVISLPIAGRIELGADTAVRIMPPEAPAQVHIVRGTLQTESASELVSAIPMSITTPHSMIRANGSSVITCGMGNTSTIEMGAGSAQVTDMGNGSTISLTSGKIAVAKPRTKQSQNISIVPPKNEKPRFVWEYSAGPVFAGQLLPTRNQIAYTTTDGRLILRDITTGIVWADYPVGRVNARALDFSTDGETVLVASTERIAKLRETATGRELMAIPRLKFEPYCVALSPDGRTAAVAGTAVQGNAELKLFDTSSGLEIASYPAHTATIESVRYSPNGKWLATASRDGQVKLWDTTLSNKPIVVANHPQGARCTLFSPDSTQLISGGRDGLIRIWNVASQQMVAELDPPPRDITCLAISHDGKKLAAGVGGSIWIFGLEDKKAMQVLSGHKNKVNSVSFSIDQSQLISTGMDSFVKVWDLMIR